MSTTDDEYVVMPKLQWIQILNAIREKNGTTDYILSSEAAEQILEISTGITPTGTKSITSNGTHDVTNYASASVNVPLPDGYIKPTGTKSITSNGTHNVNDFTYASVNVPIPSGYIVPSGATNITSNGTYDISSYANANVNVPIPNGYVLPSQTKGYTLYTPTTYDLTIAAGTYCSEQQTIRGDSNLVASNIKKNVSVFGVTGTLETGMEMETVTVETEANGYGGRLSISTEKSNLLNKHGAIPDLVYVRSLATEDDGSIDTTGGCIAFLQGGNIGNRWLMTYKIGYNSSLVIGIETSSEYISAEILLGGSFLISSSSTNRYNRFVGDYSVTMFYYT